MKNIDFAFISWFFSILAWVLYEIYNVEIFAWFVYLFLVLTFIGAIWVND